MIKVRLPVIYLLCAVILLVSPGCSRGSLFPLAAGGPPQPEVRVAAKKIPVYQSTYCWGSKCLDYVEPAMQLKDKAKPFIPAGAKIVVKFPASSRPSEYRVSFSGVNERSTDVAAENGAFMAPDVPGVYYYTISAVWWRDKKKRIVNGDSSYVFAVQVK